MTRRFRSRSVPMALAAPRFAHPTERRWAVPRSDRQSAWLLILLVASACGDAATVAVPSHDASSSEPIVPADDAAVAGTPDSAATMPDGSSSPDGAPTGAPDGSASTAIPDAGLSGSTVDAVSSTPGPDGGPFEPRPDPGYRYLTAPPAPDCDSSITADDFEPLAGFSGGIPGTKTCGPSSPSCPTTYVAGNTGAPCSSASDCTGLNPVCLEGAKYPGGMCSATGCELGSNFGCPAGDTCINGGSQTFCVQGCGIHKTGCFVHCERSGYSCFTTESESLGTCFGTDGVRQCDPLASNTCTQPSFGAGICIQTSWDDQTVGRCFETCDPLWQDCSVDGQGCYSLYEYPNTPICFQSWGFPEGSECSRMTQCAEGLRCACDTPDSPCPTRMRCRQYCATNGSVPCPGGMTCRAVALGSRWGSCHPTQ
jgi:hypothetical protein